MSNKSQRGTKRTCQSCESRFYDLNRDPIICPICESPFVIEVKTRSSADLEEAKPAKAKIPVKDFPVEEGLPLGEDLPEIETGDELADIETDAAEIEPAGEDDTFLEEEETGPDVGGLIDSPIEGEDSETT